MITTSHIYKYRPQDVARCEGTARSECQTCTRNLHMNPVHPHAMWQPIIAPWTGHGPCPDRRPAEGQA